ncbi:MAG: hypothetical protein HZB21_02090, partial [Deltaproteobacteria bacterium]|nr:hypothetical protein [Deltaproteobacteria bacterium]
MAEDILAAPPEKAAAWLQSKGFSDGRHALKNLRLLSEGPLKGLMEEITFLAALSPSPDGALNNLEGIVKEENEETILLFLKDPLNLKRLITISGSSPFLSNIAAQPRFFEWLFLKGGLFRKKGLEVFREELKGRLKDAVSLDEAARGLRLYKRQEFLRIGSRDILG